MLPKVVEEQTQETWSKLHQRLIASDVNLSKVFSEELRRMTFLNICIIIKTLYYNYMLKLMLTY